MSQKNLIAALKELFLGSTRVSDKIVCDEFYEMRLASPVSRPNKDRHTISWMRPVRTISWYIRGENHNISLGNLIFNNRESLTPFYKFRLSQSESLPLDYQYQRASTSRYPFIIYNNRLENECVAIRLEYEDGEEFYFIPNLGRFYRFIIRLIFGDLQEYLLESSCSFSANYEISQTKLYDDFWHQQYRSEHFLPQGGDVKDTGIWYRACLDPVFLDVLRTLIRARFAERGHVAILELSSGFGFFSAKLVRMCAEEFPHKRFRLVFGDKPVEASQATTQRVVSIVRVLGARNLEIGFLHGDAADVLPPLFEKERFDIVFSEGGVLGNGIESLENNLKIYDAIVREGLRDEKSVGIYSGLEPYFLPSKNTTATFRPYPGVANFATTNLQFFTFFDRNTTVADVRKSA